VRLTIGAPDAWTMPQTQEKARQLLFDLAGFTDSRRGVGREGKPREKLGRLGVKSDALQREQLPAWFAAVCAIHNPVVAACCQTVLLTGARPGEVLQMKWADLNTQWKGLTIRDKVDGERVIPLTPCVAQLLATLPRRNLNVFSGARVPVVAAPNELHATAWKVAGLEGLTLHDPRRSFKSLTEWLEIPAGVTFDTAAPGGVRAMGCCRPKIVTLCDTLAHDQDLPAQGSESLLRVWKHGRHPSPARSQAGRDAAAPERDNQSPRDEPAGLAPAPAEGARTQGALLGLGEWQLAHDVRV